MPPAVRVCNYSQPGQYIFLEKNERPRINCAWVPTGLHTVRHLTDGEKALKVKIITETWTTSDSGNR